MAEHSKLSVKVVPGSSKNELAGWLGESLKLRVTAKPEKGKANSAVVSLLSEYLGIPKNQLSIKSGHTSSRKVVTIIGLSTSQVKKRLILSKVCR